jgi:hypothetical protein
MCESTEQMWKTITTHSMQRVALPRHDDESEMKGGNEGRGVVLIVGSQKKGIPRRLRRPWRRSSRSETRSTESGSLAAAALTRRLLRPPAIALRLASARRVRIAHRAATSSRGTPARPIWWSAHTAPTRGPRCAASRPCPCCVGRGGRSGWLSGKEEIMRMATAQFSEKKTGAAEHHSVGKVE